MIKINLLPRTINERKVVRNTAMLFGVLVVVVAMIGVLYTQLFLVPQVQAEEKLLADAQAIETQVVKIEADTTGVRGKIPPIQDKLTFIKDVLDYNLKTPKLYEEIAKWTYEKVAYLGMTCPNGTEVTMAARTKSLDDLGRFLLNMYRATDLFTEVKISGVPGYPMALGSAGGGSTGFEGMPGGGGPQANLSGIGAIATGVQNAPAAGYLGFMVNCKLKTPIAVPAFKGAQAAGTDATSGAPQNMAPPSMPSQPMPPMQGPAP